MVSGNERLIIVMGMAHSGTTVFSYVLTQHPDITCFCNGPEAFLLENDLLLTYDKEGIQKLLDDNPGKFILLKRPFSEREAVFFQLHLPDAQYYCLIKTIEEIIASWSKPTSLVEQEAREDRKYQEWKYNKCLGYAQDFPLSRYRMIHYSQMIESPEEVFAQVSKDLNLDYTFDVSIIGSGDVKQHFTPPASGYFKAGG